MPLFQSCDLADIFSCDELLLDAVQRMTKRGAVLVFTLLLEESFVSASSWRRK
jgi:hypothetical protein